ncbi:MAG: DNA mismatch repair protein MutT [Firmicutes bacterium HGW-Firmicutes-19]|jgi:8-oxo-dGTP diphosphatase|nr:MAG: DNA mismatch repair protein MutT [Firmicutes bacterium HGW-Firmicutes-19]
MKILGYYNDDQYPIKDITHTRFTARAIIVNDGRFAFVSIQGEDDFGIRDHIETIGGGIEDGESAEDTIVRECLEEAGLQVKIKDFLGVVVDHYHLIQRQTISYFYLVNVISIKEQTDRTELEKTLMGEVLWLSEEESLEMLDKPVDKVGRLIQRRDKIAFQEAIRMLEG